MCIAKTKILKTHLSLSDISLLTQLSQALLKLKFFSSLHKSWIYKSRLVENKEHSNYLQLGNYKKEY